MPARDYPDLPLGEIDPEESADVVSDDVSMEAYTGQSLDEVIEEHQPSPPPEKLDAEWVDPDVLVPNDWNPNFMPDHRKDILVLSILDNGWTAPVLVKPDDTIVDGEHRWELSKNPYIQNWPDHKPEGAEDLTPEGVPAGHVPVHRIEADRQQAMVATYQQNYATGDDDADALGELVNSLEDDDQSFAATRMGVTEDELELLLPEDDVLSDNAEELWEVPWDEEADYGDYSERIALDMLQTEADLLFHIFGGEQTATPIVKLARFIVESELYEEVNGVPDPDLGDVWSDNDEPASDD